MYRTISTWLAAPVILAAQTLSVYFLGNNNFLEPYSRANTALTQKISGTEVGLGWSEKKDTEEAVREALAAALDGKRYKQPQVAIIFGSGRENVKSVLSKARSILGDKTRIFGGLTDPGDVGNGLSSGNRGYLAGKDAAFEQKLKVKAGGVVAMTFTSDNIKFGANTTDVSDFSSISEAAKAAAQSAVNDSGKRPQEKPKVVLLTSGIGQEDAIAKEISQIVGKGVLILGANQGSNTFSVFSENSAYDKGISIGLIYTNWPLACNLVQLAYNKLQKPDSIDNMFGIRRAKEI